MNVTGALGRLTPNQLFFLLTVGTFPTEMLLLPGPLIHGLGKDALWAIVLGGVVAIAPLLLALAILRSAPDGSIIGAAKRIGRTGSFFLLVLAALLFLVTINIWASFVELLRVDLLPRTAPALLALMGLALVTYSGSGGYEVLGRSSEVIGFASLVIWVILFIMGTPFFRLENLLPVLPLRFPSLLYGVYQVASFAGEIGFVSLLGALVPNRESVPRMAVAALVTNVAILLTATAMPLLVYGQEHAAQFTLPTLSAVRSMHYGFTIERVDTLIVPATIGLVALKTAIWGLMGGTLLEAASAGRLPGRRISPVILAVTAAVSLTLPSIPAVEVNVREIWYGLSAPIMAGTFFILGVACAGGRRPRTYA